MAAMCQACGLDVGHERIGQDGVSSWLFAVTTDRVPFHGEDRNRGAAHYSFDRTIHVVRHPLKVIASTALTDMNGAIEWQSQFVHVDLKANSVRQALQTWVGWTDIADTIADTTIQVEQAADILPAMLERRCAVFPPTNINSRDHTQLTVNDIKACVTAAEFEQLEATAHRYGYTL